MNKNKVLSDLATLIQSNKDAIITSNQKDLRLAQNIDETLKDRLKVDDSKIAGMISAIEKVIQIDDPEMKLLSEYIHPNGMLVQNRVVPFGRILIIYESRPDVTIEAAISAFKAGNKIFLKGGKEAKNTNLQLIKLWHKALANNNENKDWITYLDIDRIETQHIIKDNPYRIDLIIPRGGEGLISYIKSNTDIPLIISGRGNNFLFIDENVDFDMAINIILNGKSRLSVCNALDKVIIHTSLPSLDIKLNQLIDKLSAKGLEVLGNNQIQKLIPKVTVVDGDEILSEEFLSPKIYLMLSNSLEEAIQTINKYAGGHSAVIVTKDKTKAAQFQLQVDCAAVYHNASTRFTDGGQFGMGAEIAISTQKLHFRGPVGLSELVSNKWFITGNGQVR